MQNEGSGRRSPPHFALLIANFAFYIEAGHAMRIVRVTSYLVDIPIRREVMITSSLGTHARSRYVLVRMETDAGIEGAGEATVMPRWSGETAEGAYALIERHLGPAVVGRDPLDVDGLLAAL